MFIQQSSLLSATPQKFMNTAMFPLVIVTVCFMSNRSQFSHKLPKYLYEDLLPVYSCLSVEHRRGIKGKTGNKTSDSYRSLQNTEINHSWESAALLWSSHQLLLHCQREEDCSGWQLGNVVGSAHISTCQVVSSL